MSSGAVLNVRRDVDDVFYRYKMPALLSKTEGRGNGIKTVVLNLQDVARSLVRPPVYILKFFGNEVGAQTISSEQDSRYILTGVHPVDSLQNILDSFIKSFVLCGSCLNPETDLVVTKDEMINKVCKACGKTTIGDMRHKLASFIVKNPPEKFTLAAGAEEIQDEDVLREEDFDLANLSLQPEGEDESLLDVEFTAGKPDNVSLFCEAISALPSKELTAHRAREIAVKFQVPDHVAVAVLAQTVFGEELLKDGQIQKFAPVLKEFIRDNERCELALLGATERIVAIHCPSLITRTHAIFAAYYQLELVSEDSFIFWNTHISKRYVDKATGLKVRQAAAPFFEWLQNAEEDEEEEEEDEE